VPNFSFNAFAVVITTSTIANFITEVLSTRNQIFTLSLFDFLEGEIETLLNLTFVTVFTTLTFADIVAKVVSYLAEMLNTPRGIHLVDGAFKGEVSTHNTNFFHNL
jgi:hypothetical protein